MTRGRRRLLAALLLLPALLAACGEEEVACTEEFRVLTVYVEDAAGAPVADATVTTVLARTGDTLVVTSIADFLTGTYPYADDGALSRLRPDPDSLAVTLRRGPDGFMLGYRVDNGGGCHIRKLAGPDTLALP